MHAVERLEQAIATAERIGLGVRYEYLNGVNGGICEFAGRKWIFVDLALPVDEQLGLVIQAIKAIVDHADGSGSVVSASRSARAA